MKRQRTWKRLTAWLLACAMVLGNSSFAALAEELESAAVETATEAAVVSEAATVTEASAEKEESAESLDEIAEDTSAAEDTRGGVRSDNRRFHHI